MDGASRVVRVGLVVGMMVLVRVSGWSNENYETKNRLVLALTGRPIV
jgi:hypothetical protein